MTAVQSEVSGCVTPQDQGVSIRTVVLALMIFAVVLSPEFTIREGLYQPRFEDFILFAVVAVWVLGLPSRRLDTGLSNNGSPGNSVLTRIIAWMFYFATISIGIGTIAFQQPLIFNDWMVLPMFVRYWLTLQVGQWIGGVVEKRFFLWVLLFSLGVSAGIGVLQHFNLLGVNDWLTPRYVHTAQETIGLELVQLGHPGGRVVGTHGEPRHYAYMMVVGVGLCSAILANLRGHSIRIVALVVLGLSLAAVGFAASRSAVLSTMLVSLVAAVAQLQKPDGIKRSISLLLMILIVIALGAQLFVFATFEDRVMDLQSSSFERSVRARIRDFREPFERALDAPLIWLTGRGPSKAVMRTNSHNDFGWYFHRFGLPGLLLYLFLILNALKLSLQTWKNKDDGLSRTISMAVLLSVVNWFLFAMAENILKDSQLMSLNMLLIGACLGISRTEQEA